MPYAGDADQLALVQRVERRIDAVVPDGQTEGVNRAGIYENLETAVRKILRSVDDFILLFSAADGTAAAEAGKAAYPAANSYAWRIPLPADFIRFLRIDMTSWERPVDELVLRDSAVYKLQANPSQRHDTYRPLAVLIPLVSAPANQGLEVYPYDAADEVTEFSYVAAVDPEDIATDIKSAMIWYGAGLTLLDTDQYNRAGQAFEAAAQELTHLRIDISGDEKPITISPSGVMES